MKLPSFLTGGSEQDRFAQLVIARLRKWGLKGKPLYDKEQFKLSLPSGANMFLFNSFKAWQAAVGAAKDQQLDIVVGFLNEDRRAGALKEVAPSLLPTIRNRSQIQSAYFTSVAGLEPGVYDGATRVICDDLLLLIAIDRPTSMQLLHGNALREWSAGFDDIAELATENLRAVSPCKFVPMRGGFHLSNYGDHYDGSRILLPHLFGQLNLRGDPVVVVLSREAIVVAGSDDVEGLDAMAKFVEAELPKVLRPTSCLPIVHRDGVWSRLEKEREGCERLDALSVRQRLWDYAEQKPLLEQHLAQAGRDLFVASLLNFEGDGRLRTFSTWTYNAATLLPQADAVYVKANEEQPAVARAWSDVVRICGPIPEEPNVYPPRFLVERGPMPEQWEQLQACEWPPWFPKPEA